MKISDWLDEKEAENVDVSQIVLPAEMSYDEVPDEILFFKEIKPWVSLHRQSSLFYGRTLRTLVLLQRPGQEGRYSFIKHEVEDVYQG